MREVRRKGKIILRIACGDYASHSPHAANPLEAAFALSLADFAVLCFCACSQSSIFPPCSRDKKIGIAQADDKLWLATFMSYDLGYFDEDACRLEPIANPFGPKVLPMSPEKTVTHVCQTTAKTPSLATSKSAPLIG